MATGKTTVNLSLRLGKSLGRNTRFQGIFHDFPKFLCSSPNNNTILVDCELNADGTCFTAWRTTRMSSSSDTGELLPME